MAMILVLRSKVQKHTHPMQGGCLVNTADAKELFGYVPGVLRAYVEPKRLDALTLTLHLVIGVQVYLG